MSLTGRQQSYINRLLDDLATDGKAQLAVEAFNRVTNGNEANIGSAKGSGTGLRKRLARISLTQASALIDALKELG